MPKLQKIYPLGDYNTNQIKLFTRDLESEGINADIVYIQRPDGHQNPSEYIFSIPLDKVQFIVPDAFAGIFGMDLAKNLTLAQLGVIGIKGDLYLKTAVKIALNKSTDPRAEELKNYINSSPVWQI